MQATFAFEAEKTRLLRAIHFVNRPRSVVIANADYEPTRLLITGRTNVTTRYSSEFQYLIPREFFSVWERLSASR